MINLTNVFQVPVTEGREESHTGAQCIHNHEPGGIVQTEERFQHCTDFVADGARLALRFAVG